MVVHFTRKRFEGNALNKNRKTVSMLSKNFREIFVLKFFSSNAHPKNSTFFFTAILLFYLSSAFWYHNEWLIVTI